MKQPGPFITIVDKNGDVCDVISRNSSMQLVRSNIELHDRNKKWNAPHTAWIWNGAVWYPFKV